MTMTIERPDRDLAELFGPRPGRDELATAATRGSRPGPTMRACSMSPTAPSTPRSARCCWPPPRPGWSGSPTSAKASTRARKAWRARSAPESSQPRGGSTRPPASSRSTSPGAAPPSTCRSTCASRPASAARCWPTCRPSATEQTASYQSVAAAVHNPKAVRAVGTACATNPLPVVIPCHRVVRSDGQLGAYLGGPEIKHQLLDLEAQR